MRQIFRGGAWLFGLIVFLPMTALARAEIYVPLGSANAVAVVDTEADRLITEIPGVTASHGLAVSPDGRLLVAGSLVEHPKGALPSKPEGMSDSEHAAHHGGASAGATHTPKAASPRVGTVYLIDTGHRRVLRQIDVPGAVHHVTVTPNGRYAVATHPGRGSVSVVDIHGHRVHKELPTGPTPNYAVPKRDGGRVYVSNAGDGTVSEIDTANWTVLRKLPAGKTPEHMVLSPDERYLYVVNPAAGTVSRVDLERGEVTATYTVGRDPHGVALSDDGRLLYASSKADNKLVAFDLDSGKERTLSLAPAPYHVTVIPGRGKLYVSSRKAPKIWVVDQGSMMVRGEIPIRGEAHQMGMSGY